MALISNNDDECFPPTEFFVSSMIFQSRHQNNAQHTSPSFSKFSKKFHESPKHVPCPTCWRSSNNFACPNCIQGIGQLSQQKSKMDDLRGQKRRLLDEVVRLYAAKNLNAAEELRTAERTAQLRLRTLKLVAAMRAETCAAKLRQVRAMRAEANGKRRAVERLMSTHSAQAGQDTSAYLAMVPKSNVHPTLGAARHRLFETRRRLAHELFTQIFTINRDDESNAGHCFSEAAHKNLSDDVTYFERRATVRRSCGDLTCYSKSRLPERQILAPILDQSNSDLVEALTEARLTNFFVDRWFFMGRQQSNQKFILAEWCAIEDFSCYDSWTPLIFGRSTDVLPISSDTLLPQNYARGCLAALTYAARLVDGLARLFDAHLPPSMPAFFDVSTGQPLDDAQFAALSLAFNARVVALCASLGVTWQIHFSRPFHNLHRLAATCSSGSSARDGLVSQRLAADHPPPVPDAVCSRDFRRAANAVVVRWPTAAASMEILPATSDQRRLRRGEGGVTGTAYVADDGATVCRRQRFAANDVIERRSTAAAFSKKNDGIVHRMGVDGGGEINFDQQEGAAEEDEWVTVSGERLIDWSSVAPISTHSGTTKHRTPVNSQAVDPPSSNRTAGSSAASLVNLMTSATTSVVNLFKNPNF